MSFLNRRIRAPIAADADNLIACSRCVALRRQVCRIHRIRCGNTDQADLRFHVVINQMPSDPLRCGRAKQVDPNPAVFRCIAEHVTAGDDQRLAFLGVDDGSRSARKTVFIFNTQPYACSQ